MKAKIRKRSGLPLVRNLIVTAFVILFFLGVIIMYYGMLFTETRDNIILNGELNADCVVVVFDVNGLKRMNDALGHEAGDELITAAASCIRACFAGVDTIYRTGGDEFCVILTDAEEENVLACLAELERATAAWKGRFVDGFSVSCGVGSSAEHDGIEAIIKAADRKMYDCKSDYYRRAGIDRRSAR